MKKLQNILFVTKPSVYLSLDGENIVIRQNNEVLRRVPLHNLEGIITFGWKGVSPALMRKCTEAGISLAFFSRSGRFLASVVGEARGNVLLRRIQYRVADDVARSVAIARNMLLGKIYNSRWVLERTRRSYELRVDTAKIKRVSEQLVDVQGLIRDASARGELFGLEGEAASRYFSVFDEMVLSNKEDFFFKARSRRPPLNNLNAMLSFAYALLENDVASALSGVGLDPFVGFLHTDKPGRRSLALDMMEELRAVVADRFVLALINTRQL